MTQLTVEVNSHQVQKALERLLARTRNLAPAMKAIARTLERRAQTRFDLKEDPDGRAWRPWAASTRKAREQEGRGTLLEYTGHMRDSLASRYDNDSAEVGFGVPYAKHHEFRGRRLLRSSTGGLALDDTRAVVKALESQLARVVREAGQ